MKIAYVSLHWPRTQKTGVGRKIESQLAAWNRAGHQIRLFMHTTRHQPESELIVSERFFFGGPGGPARELARIGAMARMLRSIDLFRPDLIYLRYGIYVFPAHQLMGIAPVVEEINTNDISQHAGLGIVYGLYNRLTRGILLRRVRGIVSVSSELALSRAVAAFRKPVIVIGNGIDLESCEPLPPPQNDVPHLFFIATPGHNWHGVDKLVRLARMQSDLIIDVVGYDRIEGMGAMPANLHLRGYLEAGEYLNVLREADIAAGTLALHRKSMEEASPLKVRECLAYGVPSVLAYADTDLNDLACDFLLRIPNREDNMETHGRAIRDFAHRMRRRRADRRALEPRIGSRAKEQRRLAFLERIAHSAT